MAKSLDWEKLKRGDLGSAAESGLPNTKLSWSIIGKSLRQGAAQPSIATLSALKELECIKSVEDLLRSPNAGIPGKEYETTGSFRDYLEDCDELDT